ncbi:thiol-disulfide oxidoreductase ResA [Paramagnetospirillum kuznetsovii]|uniref:Thiol-disulfide oxidoreductase ResA n=1 Tax=Paramagnetospirillum kuznetsovii TaxID=2053833 RepID=A0A364NVD4_9PROT|nr:TlpA disulfide reductase family protein [Paramagnetospirillum kuznetsovii]RAU20865.1 thiol-disulfide oxidoreductase ResA [Paramagnetospirillum kuznetsovii]
MNAVRVLGTLSAAAVAFGLLGLFFGRPSQDQPPPPGVAAIPAGERAAIRPFSMIDGDGGSVAFADLRGKPMLIHFWATWCGPCVAEMPQIDALQRRFKSSGFKVLTISVDRGGPDVVKRYMKNAALTNLPVLLASEDTPQPPVVPTSLLVDKTGRVVTTIIGPGQWDRAETNASIAALLAE